MANRVDEIAASDRHVAVATFTAAAVDSFLKRREQRDTFSERTSAQAVWGVAARSVLPLLDARARFDYSLYVPEDGAVFPGLDAAGVGEEQHLVRFALEDRYRFVAYGGSLFTADDAFASQPLAQERLVAAGLPGPGAGRELWASAELPLGLRPSFRRVAMDSESGDGDLMRHTSTTTLGLTSPIPRGSLFLRNVRFFEDASASPSTTSRFRWELGGTVNAFGDMTVSPLFARERQFEGAAQAWESQLAGIDIHTRLLDATVLDLHLHHDRHDNPFAAPQDSIAARLALTTPLRPWPRTPPGLTMTAAVGYLARSGVEATQPDEGVSLRLSFSFQAGG